MRIRIICVMFLLGSVARAAEPDGALIYRTKCIHCHGEQGQGTKRYSGRLEGDRSVAQLADVIAKTMPESDPGSLSDKDAKAVAEYVHGRFYSQVARERNRPARVELSRLTVRQYRQSIADVVGSFRSPMKWDDKRGLNGEYFSGRRFNRQNRVAERLDSEVDFNFGVEAPVSGKIEPHEFMIRWSGSLLAPETGEYEFTVRTEHAIRFWLNNLNAPFIDAWVKSGNDTEYKGTMFLVGGRVYPLRLEFAKAKQGVDDSKNQKTKPPSVKASIALLWNRPGQVPEPIPSRQLSPSGAPESYCCSVPFPPDDRSYGWERGTTISKAWDEATTEAALDAAGYVASRVSELGGVGDKDPDRGRKLAAFAKRFAERAFRRPLDAEWTKRIDKQFDGAKDFDVALKRSILLTLKSPRFLYRETSARADAYDSAARLSFALWDSIPDSALLEAAAKGQLSTRDQIAKQAERMLVDPRAKTKLREFLMTWLKADHGLDLAKDMKKFPGFDAAAIADLRTSLELSLEDVLSSPKADFRQLFTVEELFLNSRLATFYGVRVDKGFAKVKLDPGKRAGVLTHPYLMTSFAHSAESSPIHRGVFLARGVLGVSLRPPPEAVAPLAPDLHPTLTTRERVAMQTNPTTCMTCHGIINPLGFTLEHFDPVGRYRESEKGKPIDARGSYQTRNGQRVEVNGARELAAFVASSPEARAAFAEQLFHHLLQQPVRAYGPDAMDRLIQSFTANELNIRKLAVDAATMSAMIPNPPATQK